MAGSDRASAHGGTALRQTRVDEIAVAETSYPPVPAAPGWTLPLLLASSGAVRSG